MVLLPGPWEKSCQIDQNWNALATGKFFGCRYFTFSSAARNALGKGQVFLPPFLKALYEYTALCRMPKTVGCYSQAFQKLQSPFADQPNTSTDLYLLASRSTQEPDLLLLLLFQELATLLGKTDFMTKYPDTFHYFKCRHYLTNYSYMPQLAKSLSLLLCERFRLFK